MEIYLLPFLVVLNGFFAMSEIALVSARKARLQPLIDRGSGTARVAVTLGSEPTRFLSTVQIGITSVAMLTGIVGEATLAPPLALRLEGWGFASTTADYLSTGLVVAIVTYFSIVVGELVPKRGSTRCWPPALREPRKRAGAAAPALVGTAVRTNQREAVFQSLPTSANFGSLIASNALIAAALSPLRFSAMPSAICVPSGSDSPPFATAFCSVEAARV